MRQKKLERYGIEIVRFLDKDVKQGLNDVLRILEIRVEERASKMERTPPCPPQGGNMSSEILFKNFYYEDKSSQDLRKERFTSRGI